MRFMLAPKSPRAFLTARGPIRHGSVKLPGSPSFLVSPLERLLDVGRSGAGKGGSWVLTHDLVVMAKVGAS
ncbi:hypothetical protein Tco_0094168, partial [Tanacetum coccineum]